MKNIETPFDTLKDSKGQEIGVPVATSFLPNEIKHNNENVPQICSDHLEHDLITIKGRAI